MNPKKTKNANLERKRIIFFEYGVILALSCCLLAFEWGSSLTTNEVNFTSTGKPTDAELAPVTPNRPTPPLPPPPLIPVFEIVEPDVKIEEPEILFTSETTTWEIIDLFNIPEEEEKPEDIIICHFPDTDAVFGDGGIKSFQKYVYENLIYNKEAIILGLEGRVIVKFIIDEEGRLVHPEILRGVDPLLDDEVIRVLKNSPRWKPGKQRMRPVKVSFVIPVIFKIQ